MGLTKWILKKAAPVPQVETFRRFLFVGPHPDDIEIGAGATAAKLAAQGKAVCFVICTNGRFGDGAADVSSAELAALRKQEAIASARMLGVTDVRFLELCDGGFYEKEELIQRLAQVVGSFQPEIILAPDPDVTSECHPDHRNAGEAARQIAYFAPYGSIMARCGAKSAPVQALAYFMTAKPNRFVKTSGYLPLQDRAIFQCHRSQFPEGSSEGSALRLYLKLRAIDFGLRSGKGRAEGYRVLGVTHMHCLPEAGD